jgi:leucyl aminopeptidase
MSDLPLAVSLASAADDSSVVGLEVSFVAQDDPAAVERQLSGRAARQVARSLGARVLGAGGTVHVLGGLPLQAVVGLGERAEMTLDTLRRAAAHAVACATDLRRAAFSLRVPRRLPAGVSPEQAAEALAEGALLAAHAHTPRATLTPKPDAAKPPERCLLRLPLGVRASDAQANVREQRAAAGVRRAEALAAAVVLARELGDAPANRLAPRQLAEQAVQAASAAGLTGEVLGPEALERLGAGLLLAVGTGSARPPALGVLRYAPPGAVRHIAVVGKGITFDAGGINVKPAKGMADMVHDKAGAAAAAAIAVGAAHLGLPVAVTAVLACAENLPSGAAYRPGDVLRGMDGATVEVVDTDAEGRLVLADALTFALRLSAPRPVDAIVDLATLTGSIVSALGNEAAGLFANDDELARRMLAAAAAAGEPLWRMPILAGHRAQLKSERADRKQCADRWGDCAIAAAFLEMYVDKRPWLHLDIAGVAYNEGSPEWPPYHPKSGAAGAGVRTVLRFLAGLDLTHDSG